MLHCLDLYGADLSKGVGKFKNTPLMAALMRWNVRILDYLMVRGADPNEKDAFGFTALKKAEIKNLRNTTAMLQDYQVRYMIQNPTAAITNSLWQEKLEGKKFSDYETVTLTEKDNEVTRWKPTDSLKKGRYPFADGQAISFVYCMFHNFHFFTSNDRKMVN